MPNRLQEETSPYLLQHADNPVDWYPWGEEAFALARERDVPVLLSIGYSACHWCHVMAHESFEDHDTADVMNTLFVNVKVDREERPDVDKIYQLAHQLLTQRGGGWPLTMFLSAADQRPFFGGTYFPKSARYGMPAFTDLLHNVASYYREQRDAIEQQGKQLVGVMERLQPATGDAQSVESLGEKTQAQAREHFARTFDQDYGGFGGAPKFPHPTTLDFLLRTWRATANDAEPDLDALLMATLTLKRMADGGLFDHLGGGFCRYTVDGYWQIPHFEKMLYDNGPLLANYAQAYLACGESHFAEVAGRTADWILADMRANNGGLFSSRDADSEGVEGKFYVWQADAVQNLLSPQEFTAASMRYGLDGDANFEGNWHLTVQRTIEDIAAELELSEDEVQQHLKSAHELLLQERSKRVAPERDEKQIAAWNALAIRGLAIAGRVLDREDLVDAANDAVEFIRDRHMVNGRLLSVYKDGEARFPAYLDDHAFLLDALLELLQARWNSEHLSFAIELADTLLQQFEDDASGGFWFTADDHETLMHRPKPFADEATPSGNGIAAMALQRLGFLLGETRYLEAAERTLVAAAEAIKEYPHGHVSLLNALTESRQHPEIVIIRGSEATEWSASAAKLYAPGRLIFAIGPEDTSLPEALADKPAIDGKTVAYVCKGSACDLPVDTWRKLASRLSGH